MTIVGLIKQSLSIEDALELYTNADLSRTRGGTSKNIRCPFHFDNNPSFSYKPEDSIWRCWSGCGYGDVISLVATARGISNGDAIKLLVKDLGLERRDKTTNHIVKKKMKNAEEETAILKEYNKRYQEAFNFLLVFEGELRVIKRQIPAGQGGLYAEVFHTLPKIEHWLDCMVHGEFEYQVKAVKYAESFIRRLIRE